MYLTLFVLYCLAVCRAADLARPWDIELTKSPSEEPNTCQNWADVVQRAYDEVETLVDAALRDLKIVREKRPDWATDIDGRKKYENWNRIDRNLQTFFGFSMDPEEPDADSEYMKNILEVLEPMFKTLKEGSEPELHYKVQFEKAAIACSDEGWKYIAPGDVDPNDLEARPLRDVPGREKFKDTGAWVWKSRYFWIKDRTTREKVNLCRPGVQAVVAHAADLLTLCLRAEDEFGEPLRVTIDRELVTKRRSLDEIMDYGGLVSTTLLHELSHLFGAWGDPTVDDWLEGATEHRVVIDQQAVNADGQLLYAGSVADEYGYRPDTTDSETDGKKNMKTLTYGYRKVVNLAKSHEDNVNTGPQKSVNTADSYPVFAVASLFSDLDWTQGTRPEPFVFDTNS